MSDLKKIWRNRMNILEGVANSILIKQEIEKVAKSRLEICHSCTYFDPTGTSPKATIKGLPSCSACGCVLHLKVHCMSCNCGMEELGLTPLWTKELEQNEEDSLPLE